MCVSLDKHRDKMSQVFSWAADPWLQHTSPLRPMPRVVAVTVLTEIVQGKPVLFASLNEENESHKEEKDVTQRLSSPF